MAQPDIGQIAVTVHGASGFNIGEAGLANPFVLIQIFGCDEKLTKVLRQTVTPVWNEEFLLPIKKPFGTVELHVLSEGAFGNRTYLGTAIIDMCLYGDSVPSGKVSCKLVSRNHQIKQVVSSPSPVLGTIEVEVKLTVQDVWKECYLGAKCLRQDNLPNAFRLLGNAITFAQNEPEPGKLKPFLAEILVQRCHVYLAMKQYTEALADIDKAVGIAPDSAEVLFHKGVVHFVTKDFPTALAIFDKAFMLDQTLPIASFKQEINQQQSIQEIKTKLESVTKLFLAKKFDESCNEIQEIMNLNPNQGIYFLYRACIYLGAHKWPEATADIMNFAKKCPSWLKENADKSGELFKRGEYNWAYQKRWFVLVNNFFLFYYKHSYDQQPQGVILCYRVKLEQKQKELIIYAPRRLFKLKAETDSGTNEWATFLGQSSKANLRIPRQPNMETNFELGDKDIFGSTILGKVLGAGQKVLNLLPQPVQDITKDIRTNVSSIVKSTTEAAHAVGSSVVLAFSPVPLVPQNIRIQGFLGKLRIVGTGFEKLYFVLEHINLYYFIRKPEPRGPQDPLSDIPPIGNFKLDSIVHVGKCGDKSLGAAFELTRQSVVLGTETTVLQAETDEECQKWIDSIKAVTKSEETTNVANPSTIASTVLTGDDETIEQKYDPTDKSEESEFEADDERTVRREKSSAHYRSQSLELPAPPAPSTAAQPIRAKKSAEDRYFAEFGLSPVSSPNLSTTPRSRNSLPLPSIDSNPSTDVEIENVVDDNSSSFVSANKNDGKSSNYFYTSEEEEQYIKSLKGVTTEKTKLLYDPYAEDPDKGQQKGCCNKCCVIL